MTTQSAIETITVDGGIVGEQLRRRITERNIQRVVIRQGFQPIASFSAIGGVLSGAAQSAINAMVAALASCTIDIERLTPEPPTRDPELDMAGIRWIGVAPIPEGVY